MIWLVRIKISDSYLLVDLKGAYAKFQRTMDEAMWVCAC